MGVCSFDNNHRKDNIQRQALLTGKANYISFDDLSIIIRQKEINVCKIIKNNDKCIGTGFLCIIPYPNKENLLPVLITCTHVLGNNDIKNGKEINLFFNEEKKIIKISKERVIYTSGKEQYDITMIELKQKDGLDINNMLEIDYDIFNEGELVKIYKDKSIYIIHFPNGKESSYSDSAIKNIDASNVRLKHLCQTDEGSSGAPILNMKNFRVIGIHIGRHKTENINIGVVLRAPINEFNSLLNKQLNVISPFQNKNNELNKDKKIKSNEIIIKVEVSKKDIYNNIFFLYETRENKEPLLYKFKQDDENNEDDEDNEDDEKDKKGKFIVVMPTRQETKLKELDESNVKLFINDKLTNYKKYFVPTKTGIYTIKLKLSFKITDCSSMFENCTKITEIDLSSFDSSEVKDMKDMFSWCIGLKKINLSSLNTKKVENMENMFNYCTCLENIDLSSFNTENVKNMQYMFGHCESLTNLNLSSFNTKKVKNINFMFGNCKNLISLDVSSFDYNEELSTYMTVCNCPKLKEIYAKNELKQKLKVCDFIIK